MKTATERQYLNVELKKDVARRFNGYCRDMHLKFETSECGEYIHFEVLVDEKEEKEANDFLMNL